MAKKLKLARPIISTPVSTYYSSEFKNKDDYYRKMQKGIHMQTKPMTRMSKRYKIKSIQKKSSGSSGG